MPSPETNDNDFGFLAKWLSPTALTRTRAGERVGRNDLATRLMGAMMVILLVWCVFDLGPWALAPLATIIAVIGLGPLAVRQGVRPEYWAFFVGLLAASATAVAAAMTGGAASPIGYVLLIGVVSGAMHGVPRATMLTTVIAVVVFVGTRLIGSAPTVIGDPLMAAALLVAMVCVTLGVNALSGAEIAYRHASVLDPLTGLLNRTALEDRFEELRQQANLVNAPICLVMFDLDHFKAVNDRHGHDVGDAILQEVAYQVRKTLRRFELIYRIGGEEFLIVLAGLDQREAAETAEQLRTTIDDINLTGGIGVTASFGVSCAVGDAIEFSSLYRRADQALYQAKRDGRDLVRVSEPAAPVPRVDDLISPSSRYTRKVVV